eukprot:975882-Prymnesium_polylepis.1
MPKSAVTFHRSNTSHGACARASAARCWPGANLPPRSSDPQQKAVCVRGATARCSTTVAPSTREFVRGGEQILDALDRHPTRTICAARPRRAQDNVRWWWVELEDHLVKQREQGLGVRRAIAEQPVVENVARVPAELEIIRWPTGTRRATAVRVAASCCA